jgi:hypothetical protein
MTNVFAGRGRRDRRTVGPAMPIDPKTVAVFLDASPSGKRRATHAASLAQSWGAHLVGVHVVFAGVSVHPSMCYARGHHVIEQVIIDVGELDVVAEAASALVGKHFRALCARLNVPGEFRPMAGEVRQRRPSSARSIFDLVVVGHPKPHGLPDDMAPERILLASSVPLLIVPNAWGGETIRDKVLIGWNATREARRAVSDAMAFLVAAESVTVLVIDQGAARGRTVRDGGGVGNVTARARWSGRFGSEEEA